jgi:hypothetical protein
MRITAFVVLMMLACVTRADRPDVVSAEAIPQSNSAGAQRSQIKISIATGGEPNQPVKDIYRVGERIQVVITMTNTGNEPIYVCESGSLYQDRPQLLKNGKQVPYESFQQSTMEATEKDKTCDDVNLPQQILLRPNEPTVVDWFILSKGATSFNDVAWYDPLQPGKYTLSDRRRLSCCDGPLSDSNTINFEVVPKLASDQAGSQETR